MSTYSRSGILHFGAVELATVTSVPVLLFKTRRCVSRQEAGNIMMVPVISVDCRQFKTKTPSFPVSLHANVFLEASLCRLFADLFHDLPLAHKITVNQTGAFYFSQACSEDTFNFSRDKLMIPIILSQSLWMFSVWLVFTSNLNSQTTWLKVKLKLNFFTVKTCLCALLEESTRSFSLSAILFYGGPLYFTCLA